MMKRIYVRPQIEVVKLYPETLMIGIGSGTTTPDDSDAKGNNFWAIDDWEDANWSTTKEKTWE